MALDVDAAAVDGDRVMAGACGDVGRPISQDGVVSRGAQDGVVTVALDVAADRAQVDQVRRSLWVCICPPDSEASMKP